MFIISIMFRGGDKLDVATLFDKNSFHTFLFALDASELVYQFKVADADGVITDSAHFGFGKMRKWVKSFGYSKSC